MPAPETSAARARLSALSAAQDVALLVSAALRAGEVALRYWRLAPEAWEKPDGAGPVSEADLAVNAALEAQLCAARPRYGWLSEESPDDTARLRTERVFIVDPIDGTRAYLNGESGYAVSLAVAAAGEVVAGVVHLPAKKLTYTAFLGGGARLNGVPLRPSRRADLAGAQVLTGKPSFTEQNWPGGAPPVKRVFRSSMAWRLCLAAAGEVDAMLTLRPTWEWDSAAGAVIAREAGLVVTDAQGAALVFNQPAPQAAGIIAAPAALHADLIARRGFAAR